VSDEIGGADAERHLAAIGTLHERFGQQGIAYWLFGGWAVDFWAGRLTRAHADIDIAIWRNDFEAVDRLLRGAGWQHQPQPGEDGYTGYRSGAISLDLAFLAQGDHGVVYTPLEEGGRGDWTPGAFGHEVMELGGAHARVVSLASLLADKTVDRDDPVAAAKDRADVAALGDRSAGA
jgi:hypothetical protein